MRKKNKREELVPDLTPLMDIMFLLLIPISFHIVLLQEALCVEIDAD